MGIDLDAGAADVGAAVSSVSKNISAAVVGVVAGISTLVVAAGAVGNIGIAVVGVVAGISTVGTGRISSIKVDLLITPE